MSPRPTLDLAEVRRRSDAREFWGLLAAPEDESEDAEAQRLRRANALLSRSCNGRVWALGVGSWREPNSARGMRADQVLVSKSEAALARAAEKLVDSGMRLLGWREIDGEFWAWLAGPQEERRGHQENESGRPGARSLRARADQRIADRAHHQHRHRQGPAHREVAGLVEAMEQPTPSAGQRRDWIRAAERPSAETRRGQPPEPIESFPRPEPSACGEPRTRVVESPLGGARARDSLAAPDLAVRSAWPTARISGRSEGARSRRAALHGAGVASRPRRTREEMAVLRRGWLAKARETFGALPPEERARILHERGLRAAETRRRREQREELQRLADQRGEHSDPLAHGLEEIRDVAVVEIRSDERVQSSDVGRRALGEGDDGARQRTLPFAAAQGEQEQLLDGRIADLGVLDPAGESGVSGQRIGGLDGRASAVFRRGHDRDPVYGGLETPLLESGLVASGTAIPGAAPMPVNGGNRCEHEQETT